MKSLSEVKQFKALCDDLKVGDSFSMYFSPLEDTITVSLKEYMKVVGYTDDGNESYDWELIVVVDSTKYGFCPSSTTKGRVYLDARECVEILIREMQV